MRVRAELLAEEFSRLINGHNLVRKGPALSGPFFVRLQPEPGSVGLDDVENRVRGTAACRGILNAVTQREIARPGHDAFAVPIGNGLGLDERRAYQRRGKPDGHAKN